MSQDPISNELFGEWADRDGNSLSVEPIYLGSLDNVRNGSSVEQLETLETVAIMHPIEGEHGRVVAIDGRHFVEWQVNAQGVSRSKRPRRLARIQIEGDRLVWQNWSASQFGSATEAVPFTIVNTDAGSALVYSDYVGMYETMRDITRRDVYWQDPREFHRVY